MGISLRDALCFGAGFFVGMVFVVVLGAVLLGMA